MKKILTLLFAISIVAMAEAQHGTRDNRQNDYRTDQRNYDDRYGYDNDYRYNDRYNTTTSNSRFAAERRLKEQLADLNHHYDHRIQELNYNRFMSRNQKHNQIHLLEEQRQRDINRLYIQLNQRYGNSNYNDRNTRSNRRF